MLGVRRQTCMKKFRTITKSLLIICLAIVLYYLLPKLFGYVGSESHEWTGLGVIMIGVPIITVLSVVLLVASIIEKKANSKLVHDPGAPKNKNED
jgi:hypothetical protein